MPKKQNRLRDSITLINTVRTQAPNGDITETIESQVVLRCHVWSDERVLDYTQEDIPERQIDLIVDMRKESAVENEIDKMTQAVTSRTGSRVFQVLSVDFPTLRKARITLSSTSSSFDFS